MQHDISSGGVKTVRVLKNNGPGTSSLHTVIWHELTSEKTRELAELLEKVIVDAVATWAGA